MLLSSWMSNDIRHTRCCLRRRNSLCAILFWSRRALTLLERFDFEQVSLKLFLGNTPRVFLASRLSRTGSVWRTRVRAVILLQRFRELSKCKTKKTLTSRSCSCDSLLALDCFVPAITAVSTALRERSFERDESTPLTYLTVIGTENAVGLVIRHHTAHVI